MALKKIIFTDLPDETTPISAENLNSFQDNIETAINEETTAMNNQADKKLEEVKTDADNRVKQLENNVDTKLQDFDTTSQQKLDDIQQQVDTTIEEMKGLVNADKIEELNENLTNLETEVSNDKNEITNIKDNMITYNTCTEEELQAAIQTSEENLNVLKDKDKNILNPKIPRYEGTMKEIKFALCSKNASPPSGAYTHATGGFRINFGLIDSFNNYPSGLKEQLAIIPIGCHLTADPSLVGGVSLYGTGIWGHGVSNAPHTCIAIVVYR